MTLTLGIMSCVHYKFRNNSKHDKIQFDGSYISVGEIKQAIFNQKKIGRTTDFSLQIINAQTNEGTTIITLDTHYIRNPDETSIITIIIVLIIIIL